MALSNSNFAWADIKCERAYWPANCRRFIGLVVANIMYSDKTRFRHLYTFRCGVLHLNYARCSYFLCWVGGKWVVWSVLLLCCCWGITLHAVWSWLRAKWNCRRHLEWCAHEHNIIVHKWSVVEFFCTACWWLKSWFEFIRYLVTL